MERAVEKRGRGRGTGRLAALAVPPSLVVTAALALSATATSAQTTGAGEATTRSTLDSVFTAAQAERGQATFEARCAACHAPGYFTTSTFSRSWSGRAVYYLHNTIRTTMPEDSPGSLRPGEVADLLAYILRVNGYPEGPEPLPDDSDSLRLIVWEALPDDPGR